LLLIDDAYHAFAALLFRAFAIFMLMCRRCFFFAPADSAILMPLFVIFLRRVIRRCHAFATLFYYFDTI